MGSLLLLGAGGKGSSGVITDPNFADVLLLAGFNGADAATTFTDESTHARTATFVGDAQLDTAQKHDGTASALFDGTGDAVTFPDSADWEFSGAFTIEGFARFPSLGNATYAIIHRYQGAGTRSFRIFWTRGTSTRSITASFTTDGSSNVATLASTDIDATTLMDDTWFYWCFERNASDECRLYCGNVGGNAVKVAEDLTAAGTFFGGTEALNIGGAGGGGVAFNGWIDEVRITTGVARYNTDSDFAVPSVPFPRA